MTTENKIIKLLPLKDVVRDEDLQMRVAMSGDHIDSLKEALLDKVELPPIIVYSDGINYFLADGHHRYVAHVILGKQEILSEVREGGRQAALDYAFGANKENNALPRTTKDKQRALTAAQKHHPKLSERKLAELVGVSKSMVHRYIEDLKKWSNGPLSADRDCTNGTPANAPADPQLTFFNRLEISFKPVRKSLEEILDFSDFLDPSIPKDAKLRAITDVEHNLQEMLQKIRDRKSLIANQE